MLQAARLKMILEILDKKETASVIELAKQLNCSAMTIRRDLKNLEEKNRIIRLYGGAQKLTKRHRELTTKEKSVLNTKEKSFIGTVMNELISDKQIIYIGAGTTALYALPNIKRKNLSIITNSLPSFNYLIKNTEYKVLLAGGSFVKTTEEFVGPIAERAFDGLNIDIAFAATNGIYNNNVTTSNPVQGDVQKAAFEHSKLKIIIADHTKFNTSDLFTFYHLNDLNYVITDSGISENIAEHYRQFVKLLRNGDDVHDLNHYTQPFR